MWRSFSSGARVGRVELSHTGEAHPAGRRFGVAACTTGLAMSLAAHAWVLVSSLARVLPASFDPRWDIASELFGSGEYSTSFLSEDWR